MGQSKKDRTLYVILVILSVIGFWLFENFYTPDAYTNKTKDNIDIPVPDYLMPSSTTGVVVSHDYYMLSYNEFYEQAEWVAYLLERDHLTGDNRKRPYFIEDPEVLSKSADWRNYRGSGYDRGHLCPAGDRRFSELAYNETFFTSNVSPQNRDFNSGIWNRLEIQIRNWARRYGTLFIVTGGVLEEGLEEIGEENVDVPQYFYKIVAKGNAENLNVIAFLIPNVGSREPLNQFVVSIDQIERMTGLDFFNNLSESNQMQLEKPQTPLDGNSKFLPLAGSSPTSRRQRARP